MKTLQVKDGFLFSTKSRPNSKQMEKEFKSVDFESQNVLKNYSQSLGERMSRSHMHNVGISSSIQENILEKSMNMGKKRKLSDKCVPGKSW